ncbi:hypothetical protein GQ42DRAFT_157433 [Ramicandelaber brevisporus]|nr:hypothetical protein GQ42DRAFT_157433 [Ramicandelaber brevisporus]
MPKKHLVKIIHIDGSADLKMADFVADFVADGSPELATSTTDTNDEADSSSISSSYETSDEFAPGREEVEGEAEEEEVFEIADYTSASGWERLVSAIERVLTGWLRAEPAEQRAVVKWQQQELEMLYLACDDLLHTPTATANGVEETYRIFPRVKPSEPASVLHLWTNEPRYIVLRPPSRK